jgi:hypothetical protein
LLLYKKTIQVPTAPFLGEKWVGLVLNPNRSPPWSDSFWIRGVERCQYQVDSANPSSKERRY